MSNKKSTKPVTAENSMAKADAIDLPHGAVITWGSAMWGEGDLKDTIWCEMTFPGQIPVPTFFQSPDPVFYLLKDGEWGDVKPYEELPFIRKRKARAFRDSIKRHFFKVSDYPFINAPPAYHLSPDQKELSIVRDTISMFYLACWTYYKTHMNEQRDKAVIVFPDDGQIEKDLPVPDYPLTGFDDYALN